MTPSLSTGELGLQYLKDGIKLHIHVCVYIYTYIYKKRERALIKLWQLNNTGNTSTLFVVLSVMHIIGEQSKLAT